MFNYFLAKDMVQFSLESCVSYLQSNSEILAVSLDLNAYIQEMSICFWIRLVVCLINLRIEFLFDYFLAIDLVQSS